MGVKVGINSSCSSGMCYSKSLVGNYRQFIRLPASPLAISFNIVSMTRLPIRTFSVGAFLLLFLTSNGQHNLLPRFDSVMKAYESLHWNAMVVVGNTDSVIYEKSIGFSQVKDRLPFTRNTLFQSASVGKMFTSTRILQLVKAGKINLTQPVNKYLPDWKLPNLDKINIHHLLTHTSGLASAWDHPDYDFKKEYTAAELKKLIEEVPLAFQTPGERSGYSNIGYTLLGEIIARMDNMSFRRSIEQYIFGPAGIKLNDKPGVGQVATPYYQVRSTDFLVDEEMAIQRSQPGDGAGGWMLTPMDLYRFLAAWLKDSYLDSQDQLVQITANHTIDSTKPDFRYGLAPLVVKFSTPHFIYGHNGGGKGYSLDAFFDPRTKLIVVMASNQYASSYTITRNLFRVLYQEPIVYPEHSPTVKIMEGIQKWGSAFLVDQPDTFFAKISLKPTEGLFSRTYFILELNKEYAFAADLLTAGRNKFPDFGYMWYNSGLVAVKRQQKQEALQFFSKAKALAITSRDEILLKQSEAQLALLHP